MEYEFVALGVDFGLKKGDRNVHPYVANRINRTCAIILGDAIWVAVMMLRFVCVFVKDEKDLYGFPCAKKVVQAEYMM